MFNLWQWLKKPPTIASHLELGQLGEKLALDFLSQQGYHPIAWAHELYGGRVFYTAFGHNPDDWSDPNVLEITARAIEWAAHKR